MKRYSWQLNLQDGKQDFYLAAFGNFCILDIDKNGFVKVSPARVSRSSQEEFERNTLLFYTGVQRSSVSVLAEQQQDLKSNNEVSIDLKHQTKKIGRNILNAFESNELDSFGDLLHEHWVLKKKMSDKMSNPLFDDIYSKIRLAGAIGGKIVGAGGGGFFLVYCRDGSQTAVRKIFSNYGCREMKYRVDAGGTQVLLHRPRGFNTI